MELHQGESAYEETLAGVFNGDASASHPACIAQPGDEQEVAFFIRQARDQNRPLRVRSGGHSRFCSGDGALMLDLAAHWRAVSVSGDLVRVQGGCGVGAVLQALAPHGRMLPVGTHATPGFGLLTMGGLGHLSRSFGLTLDCVEVLRGVRADGERFEIRADAVEEQQRRVVAGFVEPPVGHAERPAANVHHFDRGGHFFAGLCVHACFVPNGF